MDARDAINSRFRWFRLRNAGEEECVLPYELKAKRWMIFFACDGSGIYNGALGPLRLHLRPRKKGRSTDQPQPYKQLIVDGHEIHTAEVKKLLTTLLENADDVVFMLTDQSIDDLELVKAVKRSIVYDIEKELQSPPEIFSTVNQSIRLTRNIAAGASMNDQMDPSGGPTSS